MDDIRFYKRALTAEEVKYLYQNWRSAVDLYRGIAQAVPFFYAMKSVLIAV
jgi:hypothetical protein